MRMKIIGNSKLNTIDIGLEKMAIKLAFVMAHKAFD
jgi:hypothetical protein